MKIRAGKSSAHGHPIAGGKRDEYGNGETAGAFGAMFYLVPVHPQLSGEAPLTARHKPLECRYFTRTKALAALSPSWLGTAAKPSSVLVTQGMLGGRGGQRR